jgi:hypothetical protein
MARWDRNWQGAAHGRGGLRLQRDPQRGGLTQSGKAVLSDGKSAPLNRAAGRDPLMSQPAGDVRSLATRDREVSTGRLVNAPSDDGASECLTAKATARAFMPDGRAGRHPFASGPPQPTREPAETTPTDLQQTLYVMIVQEWVQTLTGPFDWGGWPLDRYVFSETFHQPLDRQENLDNAAWVCAMVACGLAHEFAELEDRPRPAGVGDGQLVREDRAKGYRCTIISGRGAGSRLDYWRLPSGVIEFNAFTTMRLVRSPPGTKQEEPEC